MTRSAPLSVIAALVLLMAGLAGALLLGTVPGARGATPAVTGSINGPSVVGESLKANYTVTATGGPAEASNGTTIGTYAYNATLAGSNTTGASINPSTGVLLNGSVVLDLVAPAVAEDLTITVLITSSYQKSNQSSNLSYALRIVEPYRLNATLVAGAGASIGPLKLTVTLDGTPVGSISVPVLTAGSTYPIAFSYVDLGLASEHGLVTFPGGAQQYSETFYVNGPPPDYTLWYAAGSVAFVGALFIWSTRVAARRRGRAKK